MTKPKARTSTAFPSAFHSAGEEHPFLARYKRSLEKKLSLTRMETLFEEVDLSIYLLAVGRDSEALEVAAFLPAHITFSGNHNIWSPTGNAITVGAYLLRKAGDNVAARAQLDRLIEHPSYALREPAHHKWLLEEQIPKELDEASREPSRKWACHQFARAVGRAIYWRETNLPGFPHHDYYSSNLPDRWRDLGLEQLGHRMSSSEPHVPHG